MTEYYFPFDAGAGANVAENQWAKMARLWRPDGVISGYLNMLSVYGDNTGMLVKEATGAAWLEGGYYENDSIKTLAIDASHATLDRIDRIILRMDWVNNTILVAVLKGTNAASPVAPTVTQTFGTLWEISLATVSIAATITSITAAMVTDTRTYSPAPGRISALTGGTLTISGGILTVSPTNGYGHYKIATEAAAASDDVDTITGGADGDVLVLEMGTAGQVPTLKNGTGNISLSSDLALSVVTTVVMLRKDGTTWKLVSPLAASSGPEMIAETTTVSITNTTETEIFSKSVTLDTNDLIDILLECAATDSGAGGPAIVVKVYSGATLLATANSNGLRGDGQRETGYIRVQVKGNGANAQIIVVEGNFVALSVYTHNFRMGAEASGAINWTSPADLKIKVTLITGAIGFKKYSSVYSKYSV